jgi:histidinol-phosphate aminotransferase
MKSAPVTRLHWNESSYDQADGAGAAAAAALLEMRRYPDPSRASLTGALARHWSVGNDMVVVGNGSDELILLSSLVLGDTGRPALIGAVTFPGYKNSLILSRRPYRTFDRESLAGHGGDMASLICASGLVYVCNPNNPTGEVLSREALAAIVRASVMSDVPVVFDEAYMEFTPDGTPSALEYIRTEAPIAVLRTFSKAYGMAGLRIGYAIGNGDIIARLRNAQATIPFSVNMIGQAAAVAAIGDRAVIPRVRAENTARREALCQELAALDIGFLPSQTNFVAICAARPKELAWHLRNRYGILVREVEEYGLPGHLRISVGTDTDNRLLIKALAALKPLTEREN